MRIIAYTYEADVHCPACAQARHFAGRFAIDWERHIAAAQERCTVDEHQIPICAADREGNPIHPVFDTDEHDFTHCGACREELST